MYEVTLRINHESPYADLTAREDATVEMWCKKYCDLLHVTGSNIETAIAQLEDAVGINDMVYKGSKEVVLISDRCLLDGHENLLEGYLRAHDCISLPPLTYDHGALLTRIVSLDETQLTKVYHDISESHTVTVETKRKIEAVVPDVPLLMFDSALPDLSESQRDALVKAVEAGYYEIPRDTTTAEVAKEMGISRRTFEEHLRRAENKLMKDLVEYIAV